MSFHLVGYHFIHTVSAWGVVIINVQLESVTLADTNYAQQYEEASLAIAKVCMIPFQWQWWFCFHQTLMSLLH